MFTILLAIYYPIHRLGIMSFVHSCFDQVKIIEVGDGADLMKIVSRQPISLIILDPELPGVAIKKLIKKRRRRESIPPVLIYSDGDEQVFAAGFIRMGAAGYIEQKCREDQLICAVRTILSGHRYLSTKVWSNFIKGSTGDT